MKIFALFFFITFSLFGLQAQTQIFPSREIIFDFALNPDGDLLAVAHGPAVDIWDNVHHTWRVPFELKHKGRILTLDYAHAGDKIITGGQDSLSILWNLINRDETQVLTGQQGVITAVKFSPNDSLIATASSDKTIYIWNTLHPSVPSILLGHKNDVTALEFLNNQFLISSDANGQILIWDLISKTIATTWTASSTWIRDIALRPDHLELATCGDDGKIRKWDISNIQHPVLISEIKLRRNWLMSVDYYENNFLLCGGDNRRLTVFSDPFGEYSIKTKSNIKKVLFIPQQPSFSILYSTHEDGLMSINSKDMKFKSK